MEKTAIDYATETLVEKMMESPEYKRYQKAAAKVNEFPGLREKIDEFRKNWFEIQLDGSRDLFHKTDQIEQENAELRDNPYVKEFLAAELSFCRVYQRVNFAILDSLDFDVDFLRD